MATLVPSVIDKYELLTAANFPSSTRPPIYLDEAPQVTAAGAQLRPPYVVASVDSSAEVELCFESDGVETTRVTFEVYATSVADLDTTIAAIRFNGSSVATAAGFDAGSLPSLTDGVLLSMLIDRTPTRHHDGTDRDGKNVYRGELAYTVTVQRT